MSSRSTFALRAAVGTHRVWLVLAAVVAASWSAVAPRAATPRFFPDDPIQVDDDRALDASGMINIKGGSNAYDFAENTFFSKGDKSDIRAVNVNSMDEVPDSSWFTNRIGRSAMTVAEIVRGPNQLDTISIDDWPIIEEKSSGITPGYRVVDPADKGERTFQVKFDPPSNPGMASAAEVIGAAIYHALGYNVVQGYIIEVDPARIVISPEARTVSLSGVERQLNRRDIDRLLRRGARLPNGKYIATLSRFADGRPKGYFKYYGTRPDDPNDIHAHEHRRELRANRVFAAWLNHDDSRGINSLDMLEEPGDGRKFIRHYMFDFGSIMGSGSTRPQTLRAGNEYILEWGPGFKTLATLGLYVRPWITTKYWEGAKAVGRFEGDAFDAVKWRPEYPNPAFDNMRADDAFWGARLVARFSDEIIRAIVAKGRYTEPGASEHIAATLIKRRDKVLRAWLPAVNPLIEPRLASDGTLTFQNAAEAAGVASRSSRYTLLWSRFDNTTNTHTGTVEATATEARAAGPPSVLEGAQFVSVAVRTTHPDYPVWAMPVTFTFRRVSNGWQAVGLERSVPPRPRR